MRPNRYVILVSVLLGAFGAWFSADAVGQYLNTTRSFTAIEFRYVEDSFVWLDPEHQDATAEFDIRNESDNDAVLAYMGLNLLFDGEFAGARYAPWDAVTVPAGEEIRIEVPLLVAISSMRPEGSDAELSYRGQLRLEFDGIERDMTVRMSGTIGRVPYEEQ